MDTSIPALDQVRRALSRVRSGSPAGSRSWTRSQSARPPAESPSIRRRSSFVRSASRYVQRPPER